jgi:hypothetical protein
MVMVVSPVVVRRARRVLRGAAVAVLFGATLSGCYLDEAQQIHDTTPEARPWFCVSTGVGGHHGDDDALAEPVYAGQAKGALSWDDCLTVAKNFDDAYAFANQWPTKQDAEAGGWTEEVAYAPGTGTHHFQVSSFGAAFDPGRPLFLQYGGEAPDAPLVGLSWWVQSGDLPPEGFVGGNDWWHHHGALCYVGNRVIVGDDELTDQQCAFYGGHVSRFPGYHMVHAWIIPGWQYKPDVFAGAHPCLLADGIAPPGDPCWAKAAGGATGGDHGADHGGDAHGGPTPPAQS